MKRIEKIKEKLACDSFYFNDFVKSCPFSINRLTKKNKSNYIYPYRHIGMVWMRLCGKTLKETALYFNTDYTSVIYAEKMILQELSEEKASLRTLYVPLINLILFPTLNTKKMKNDFLETLDLKKNFESILQKLGINSNDLSEQELDNMKILYYTSFGECLTMTHSILGTLEQEDTILAFTSLTDQINDFFIEFSGK